MESKMLSSGKPINFMGAEYRIRPIPLRAYRDLLSKFDEVYGLARLGELFEDGDKSGQAMEIVKAAPEKLAELCQMMTGIEKEKVLDADLESAMDLLVEGIKAHDIIGVISRAVKKVKAPAAAGPENTHSTD